jgi:hypothetical protein
MNANDLADRLEQFYTGTHIDKAAETLRQQHAEIEQLKALVISLSPNANLIYTRSKK